MIFFETLEATQSPKVIFYGKRGEALFEIDENGLEELSDTRFGAVSTFTGSTKLLWNDIEGIHVSVMRLGAMHMLILRFASLDDVLTRLSADRATRVERHVRGWRNGWCLPFKEVAELRIAGTSAVTSLDGIHNYDRGRIFGRAFNRFKIFRFDFIREGSPEYEYYKTKDIE